MLFPRSFLYVLLGTLLLAVGLVVGFKLADYTPANTPENQLSKFEEVVDFVNATYFERPDNAALIDNAIQGMLEGLDPHSFYIPAAEMKAMDEQMHGEFEGIGIEFNLLDDTLYVVSALSGGPSEKLGITSGDRIVKIDGVNVAGVGLTNSDVVKKLRGPKGTQVKVSIKRPGLRNPLEFTIVRDKIPMHSVDYSYMVNDNVGYIRVSRFAEKTFMEFIEHLNRLKRQGLKNLILDLRGNPGGYMFQAQEMADAFLKKNKLVVYTKGRVPESNSSYESTNAIAGWEEGGLIILIDQGSASASEIVSGAVQDWDRGLIVGTRSFGKGLVQTQKKLSDGSAVRIVISRYYTPSGRCIQKPYTKGKKAYEEEIYERIENGELVDPGKVKFPDSLKYKTHAGRTVYGGGGIMPDVFVPRDTSGTSEYLSKLILNGTFNRFSLRWLEQHPNLKAEYPTWREYLNRFRPQPEMIQALVAFAKEKGIAYNDADFKTSERYIRNNLKAALGRALYNDDGFFPVLLQEDETFRRALELMPQAIVLERTGKFTLK